MKRSAEKTFGLGLLVLIILLVLAAQLIAPREHGVRGSVTSSETGGRRKLFLLLQELSFAPEAWNELPGLLPHGGHLLWMPEAPNARARDADQDGPDEPAPPLDLHAPAHYRRFVEEGGVLVLPFSDRTRTFLVDVLGFADVAGIENDQASPAGVRTVHLEDAEELEAFWREGSVLEIGALASSARVVWSSSRDGEIDRAQEVLAVSIPEGSGEVILLGDGALVTDEGRPGSLFDNESVADHEHALLAVRLLERHARGGRLLFDEYALGLWQPRSTAQLALSPALFLCSLHVFVVCVLLAWHVGTARSFPRDSPALSLVSPLSRARALARLCQSAQRHALLARMLRRGVLRRLRIESSAEPVPPDLALRVGDSRSIESWREALTRPIRDARELEMLGSDLARLEAALASGSRVAPARRSLLSSRSR